MNYLETIILGIAQGLTEFIPVSSSGHLVLLQSVMNLSPDHLFIEFINFGTLFALIYFFRHKIKSIVVDVLKNKKYKLALNLLITALPAGIAGYLMAGFIEENSFFSDVYVVLAALVIVGFLMIIIEKITRFNKVSSIDQVSSRQALAIGLIQVFALIPGVSRSGSTIIAGRLLGLGSVTAAEYSFLASIPIMLGVGLKLIAKDHSYLFSNLPIVLISNLFAFIAGMFAIKFMLSFLSKKGLAVFGWYRIVLATLVLVYLLLK
jgi:undecaprenyl-diphosphatase